MKKSVVVFSCLVVLLLSGIAFAQAAVAPAASTAVAPVESLGLKGLFKGLISGSIVGFILAFLGFLKDTATDKKFDIKVAMPTVLLGAAVGALMGWDQKDISGWNAVKDNVATVVVAEILAKVGFRNGAPVIGNIVSSLIGKKADPA